MEGLLRLGWRVERSVDVLGEGIDDEVLFEHAASAGLVIVTNDGPIHAIATRWLSEGRAFRMVYWKQGHHQRMSDGGIIRGFEAIAQRERAFVYPIEYIKPG